MATHSSRRSCYRVLFRFCRQLAEGGLLTRKEADFLKDLIIQEDTDLLEVASVITHPDSMDTEDVKNLYKFFKHKVSLYIEGIAGKLYAKGSLEDAYAIAGSDTQRMTESDAQVLIYGEVDFSAFAEILRVGVSGMNQCLKFVDLGHGTGKAVIIAALLCSFEILVGVEILPGLVQASKRVLNQFNATVVPTLTDPPFVSFFQGSFLDQEHDHFDADVVFANSTCFSNELMLDIARKAEKMRVGSRFISFTVKLPSPCFKVIFKQLMRMSWGEATIFVQERIETKKTMETGLVSKVGEETLLAQRSTVSTREQTKYSLDSIEDSSSDEEEDGDLLNDLISDVESTNALYPMETRSEASSLVSGMTAEEYRLDSPSISSASGMFSPSSSRSRRDGSSTTGIAFSNTPSSPSAKSSSAALDQSVSEEVEDDWVDVSKDDGFDIFDFVKKYGATPPKYEK